MDIPIKSIYSTYDITVQRGYYEFVLEECNHAGAEEVEVCSDPGQDNERIERAIECDKCHAIQNAAGEWS